MFTHLHWVSFGARWAAAWHSDCEQVLKKPMLKRSTKSAPRNVICSVGYLQTFTLTILVRVAEGYLQRLERFWATAIKSNISYLLIFINNFGLPFSFPDGPTLFPFSIWSCSFCSTSSGGSCPESKYLCSSFKPSSSICPTRCKFGSLYKTVILASLSSLFSSSKNLSSRSISVRSLFRAAESNFGLSHTNGSETLRPIVDIPMSSIATAHVTFLRLELFPGLSCR